MIVGPPLQGSANELADWLELEALASAKGITPIHAVNQSLEIAEDVEPQELDEGDVLAERRLLQVVTAIEERRRAMPSAYPFSLDAAGIALRLADLLDAGSYAYLFCLIVSSGAPGALLSEGPAVPDLIGARDLFQACATIATAGYTRGPAHSTGWPRADSTSFLEKLRRVYNLFGDGRVHAAIPPGMPAQVKDDEIDVIAWTDNNNVMPPVGYFLGQAASGANWPDKSLKGRVDVFHDCWFDQRPASNPRVATIIPFCLPSQADADAADHESQEEIEGQLRRIQATHQEVLHRHRVAHYLGEALALVARGIGPIERLNSLPHIRDYVHTYRTRLQAAVAAQ